MPNLNGKKHLIVYSDTAWQSYADPVPDFIMLGTIQRGQHIGAMAIKNGVYYCINGAAIEPLNQSRVLKALPHARTE